MIKPRTIELIEYNLNVNLNRWQVVFLIGFVVYLAIRGAFEKRARLTEKIVHRGGAWDIALIVLVFIGSLALPVLYLFTPVLSFADYHVPPYAPWCGVVVMIISLWLFWRSHADLAENWSITLQLRKDHQLITHGVYRRIRHPMYAAIWLFGLAQGLLLENWLAGWSALVSFAVMYFIRVPREEQMMLAHFGDEYRAYAKRSGRLFPWFL